MEGIIFVGMDLQAEKLDVVQLLLNTDNKTVLDKVRDILIKSAAQDETQYLLSTEANRKHLSRRIAQLDKGKSKAIKTADLWK
jgi:hypothetical protein